MRAEIYGAAWCTYCKQAVALCESNSIQYDYIDVDDTSNLRILEQKIGGKVRSVPQIFLNGQHMPGGFVEFKKELAKN